MSEQEPIRVTRKRKQQEVQVELEDGSLETYTVKELTGTDRDDYLNSARKKIEPSVDGKGGTVKDFAGMHSDLLVRTVFSSKGIRMSVQEVQSWPNEMQRVLFDLSQKLSGLGQYAPQAEEEAKNA